MEVNDLLSYDILGTLWRNDIMTWGHDDIVTLWRHCDLLFVNDLGTESLNLFWRITTFENCVNFTVVKLDFGFYRLKSGPFSGCVIETFLYCKVIT